MTPAERIARTPRFAWLPGVAWSSHPRQQEPLPVLTDSNTYGALLMHYLDGRTVCTVPDPVLTMVAAYGRASPQAIEALVVAYEGWTLSAAADPADVGWAQILALLNEGNITGRISASRVAEALTLLGLDSAVVVAP